MRINHQKKIYLLRRSINKWITILVVFFLLFMLLPVGSSDEILIEDADTIWTTSTASSSQLTNLTQSVTPRISAIYANLLLRKLLSRSSIVDALAAGVTPRVFLLYANYFLKRELMHSSEIDTITSSANERIISYYSNLVSTVDLIPFDQDYPPNIPTNLQQWTIQGTEIPLGGIILNRTMYIRARVNDTNNDSVRLQIELRRLTENNGTFLNKYTQQSTLVNSGNQINVSITGLVKGSYHWQARTVDQYGLTSNWTSFGNNNNSASDFSVNIISPPEAIFTYSPTSPQIGEQIFFNASQSFDPDGGSVTCNWAFGDGSGGSGKTISHSYSTTGEYTVTLTVIDDELVESDYSITVRILSNNLVDTINKIVNDAKTHLQNINTQALYAGSAADFFNAQSTQDEKELEREICAMFVEPFIDAAFNEYFPVNKGVSVFSVIDAENYKEELPVLFDLIDTKGWVLPYTMMEIVKQVTTDKVIDVIDNSHKEELEKTQYNYVAAFSHLQTAQKNKLYNNLDELKTETLANLDSLTPEEITSYVNDIHKRNIGNNFVNTLYSIKVLLPKTAQDIREEYNQNVLLIWLKLYGWTTVKLALNIIFGPFSKFVEKMVDLVIHGIKIYYQLQRLKVDAQMSTVGAQFLFDGFTDRDRISRNTCQSLINIKERIDPPDINGEITSIENWARGPLQKPVHYDEYHGFFPRDVYATVKVKNNAAVETSFELSCVYYQKVSGYSLPMVYSETKDIAPHQTETYTVWFKQNGAGPDMHHEAVTYFLIGSNNENGFYDLDMESSLFGTTRIITNGVNVSSEELENASLYNYPINTDINKIDQNYSLDIYLENPFEFPVDINLSQQIPDTLIILSSENGTILNNNISWNMTLEPEEHKEINSILQPQGSTVQQVNISGAELNMYDRVHDYWIDFLSNNISFNTNIAPVAYFIYSPYPPRLNQTVTFNASYSSDVDGNISSYSWDFGDSTQASGKIVQHMYTDTGTYVVTLQVTDDKGTMSNSTQNITIKMLSPPQLNQEYPGNNSNGNGRPPSDLHLTISDPTGDSMTVYLRWMNHTGKWVTLQIYFVVGNGTYNFIPSGNDWIWGNTTYFWSVNVTDGTSWTNRTYQYTTKGSRYDVNNNNMVNFQDAGLVWTHRTSLVPYDGLYDVNDNGQVNFQDAGLTWTHRG